MNDKLKNEKVSFEEFLDLSEELRFKYLTGVQLHWWQKLEIKYINKWWSNIKKSNPNCNGIVLWESIRKGRF